MTTSSAPGERWLQGPVSDVLLGGGLLYVPILALLFLAGPGLRAAIPFFLVPLLLIVCMNAHFGATLLRVYERPEDRRAYRFFAVWVTLVVVFGFFLSLLVPIVGSVFITAYLTLVPWHFTAQNYGVALVLLRRQGVEVAPPLKRTIYAAFLLPLVLWILALHGTQPEPARYSLLDTAGTHYKFISVGIPGVVQGPAVILAILAYLWVLGECVLQMRGRASVREVLPACAVFFSQALWFAAPVVLAIFVEPAQMGPFSPGSAGFTFLWISLMHGIQYLWITNYYVKKERPGTKTPQFLVKSALIGTAFDGLPVVILAYALMGRVSFNGGIVLMIAAAISLHHIVLDGAIWKLRDGRIARILLRGVAETSPSSAPPRAHWVKRFALAAGVIGVAFSMLGATELEYGVERALERGDVERMQTAVRRMRWMGRDDAAVRAELGFLLGQQGNTAGAFREFERSIAIEPNALAWTNLGALRERQGEIQAAILAYDAALALDPDDVAALHYAGRASLKAGRRERARQLLERAVSLSPERSDLRDMLAEAAQG